MVYKYFLFLISYPRLHHDEVPEGRVIRLTPCTLCGVAKANVIQYSHMHVCEKCFADSLIPHAEKQMIVMKELLKAHQKQEKKEVVN